MALACVFECVRVRDAQGGGGAISFASKFFDEGGQHDAPLDHGLVEQHVQ